MTEQQAGEGAEVRFIVVAMREGRPALAQRRASPLVFDWLDGALFLSVEVPHAYLVSTRD